MWFRLLSGIKISRHQEGRVLRNHCKLPSKKLYGPFPIHLSLVIEMRVEKEERSIIRYSVHQFNPSDHPR